MLTLETIRNSFVSRWRRIRTQLTDVENRCWMVGKTCWEVCSTTSVFGCSSGFSPLPGTATLAVYQAHHGIIQTNSRLGFLHRTLRMNGSRGWYEKTLAFYERTAAEVAARHRASTNKDTWKSDLPARKPLSLVVLHGADFAMSPVALA